MNTIIYLLNNATWVGNIPFLQPLDAIRLIEICENEGKKILGIDAFLIQKGKVQPLMEDSIDYSINKNDKSNYYKEAKEFIFSKIEKNLYYEVIFE